MQGESSGFSQRQHGVKNLIVLAAAVIFILVLNGVLALFSLYSSNQEHLSNMETLNASMNALEAARKAQVHFKKQVQEWKNILLRGGNRQEFDKYLAAFTSEEKAVQTELETLHGFSGKIGMDLQTTALREQHTELGRRYREALRNHMPESSSPSQEKANASLPAALLVDSQIRGIDRAPTRQMDDMVLKIHVRADELSALVHKESGAHYNTWRKIIISGMVIGTILVSLMLWISFARFKP